VPAARAVRVARPATLARGAAGVPVVLVVGSVLEFRRRWTARTRRSRHRSRIVSSLRSLPRRRPDRDLDRRQVRRQCLWPDVGHGRDEGDVGVQSCIVWVKGGSVLQDRSQQSRAIPCHAVMSPRFRGHTPLRPHETLKRVRSNCDVDGIVAARREFCRYRQAADDTRGSGDVGATCAAVTARTRSLQREQRSRTVLAEGTTSRSCRRNAQSIAISARWRNPAPPSRRLSPGPKAIPGPGDVANFMPDLDSLP